MKIYLLIQFILSVLMILLSAGMIIGAFKQDSILLWKAFTIVLFVFCICLTKQALNELKQ